MGLVGSLLVRLVGDASGLNKALGESKAAVQRFGSQVQGQLGPLQQALNDSAASSKALASRLGGVATVAGAAMLAAGATGVKLAAQMEQSQIAFTTLLGNAERAKQFLGQLSDFAAKTPFEFPGLQSASRQLLAFGFTADQIIPTMTAVGDAVSAMGGGSEEITRVVRALGQMKAKGKVSAEEMMQLAELGIPVWQMLADTIGTRVTDAMKMASQGAIQASKAINGILAGMGKRFAGSMDAQSKTILGQWSTMKDNIGIIMRGIGKDLIETFDIGGVMTKLNAQLSQFASLVSQNGLRGALAQITPPWLPPVIVATAGAIAGALVPAMTALAKQAWKTAAGWLLAMKPLWGFMLVGAAVAAAGYYMVKVWGSVGAGMAAIWHAIAATGLYGASMVVRAVGMIISAAAFLVPAFRPTAQSVLGYADSLKAAAAQSWGLAKATTASKAIGQTALAAKNAASAGEQAAQAQQQMGDAIGQAGKEAGKNLQSFDEINQIQEQSAGAASDAAAAMQVPDISTPQLDMGSIGAGAMTGLSDQLGSIGQTVTTAWQNTVTTLSGVWDRLKAKAFEVFPGLKGLSDDFAGAAQWVTDNWGTVGPALEGILGTLALLGAAWLIAMSPIAPFVLAAAGVAAVAGIIMANWDTIGPFLTGIWEAVKSAVMPIWETMETAAVDIWGSVKETVSFFWEGLKIFAIEVWGAISETILVAWELIKTVAGVVWGAIYDTIVGAWSMMKDWWANWGDIILAILGGVWEQIKLTIITAINVVKDTIGLVLALIRGDWEEAWNRVKGIGKSAADYIGGTWENLKTTTSNIWGAIKNKMVELTQSAKDAVIGAWQSAATSLESIWNGIINTADRLWSGLVNIVKGPINLVIQAINRFLDALSGIKIRIPEVNIPLIGKVGGGTIGMPDIPRIPMLERGGIISSPTLAIMGEKHKKEAVVPLENTGFVQAIANAVASAVGSVMLQANQFTSSSQGNSQQALEIVINLDGTQMARAIIPAMDKERDRIGSTAVIQTI